jgi:3'-phosphoadenosine 5'-phosphosulfate sulfotransferase (PAPS reductase)/FAD synthetase
MKPDLINPMTPENSPEKTAIHIISLGAGVQSSTMALMAAEGLIKPKPSFAVFADTGDEPLEVYLWLEKLCELLPFRVKIAHRDALYGKLSDNLFQWDHSQIPAFKINPATGKPGIGKRQCTKHWKIVPVHRKIREVTETQRKRLPNGFVHLWQGISTDEISRCKLH